MFNQFLVFTLLFLIQVATCKTVEANVCIISFVIQESPEKEIIDDVFKYYPNAYILDRPDISEIKDCFNGNFDEIIWISHGVKLGIINQYVAPVAITKTGEKFPLFRRYFKMLFSEINKKPGTLFRVIYCGNGGTLDTSMSDFIYQLQQFNYEIDIAPIDDFYSRIIKHPVSLLTREWLARSIDRELLVKWRTEDNFYCKHDYWPKCSRKYAKYAIPID